MSSTATRNRNLVLTYPHYFFSAPFACSVHLHSKLSLLILPYTDFYKSNEPGNPIISTIFIPLQLDFSIFWTLSLDHIRL